MSTTDPPSSPLLQAPSPSALLLSTTPPDDPPPPYPSARRTRQNRRRRSALDSSDHSLSQPPSDDFDPSSIYHNFPHPHHDSDPTETTPLLSPHSPRPSLQPPVTHRRRRTSLTSTLRSSTSLAPSFAHTILSAFHPERDSDIDPECRDDLDYVHVPFPHEPEHEHDELDSPIAPDYDPQQRAFVADLSGYAHRQTQRPQPMFVGPRWRRYFAPLKRRAYYSALLHILVLNFPYALVSWIFLFVFTLVGTCTLMALPLDHLPRPALVPTPPPPLPIFTRTRPPTPAQLEAGAGTLVQETSFYRNTYVMFTDPTSYQALFYFLVLKPGITVLMFLFFVVVVPVSAVLVVPLPAVMRLARRVGIWQANVAVEGLYFAVR
ncbi:hypothetical protein C8Q74DRAFT_1367468 [Fomes fomentarius]|nr:hypothetical protein C8Q74DRAFT_1367468 [Fomes fomentarius]